MKKILKNLVGLVFGLTLALPAAAKNKVVVIPLIGDDATPLKNVVTVAKSGGDFTDPVAALKSITDASSNNPYLVVIGPGVYQVSETIPLKEFVNIAGSGKETTKLVGSISTGSRNASAIISGSVDSALIDMTVENTGGSTYSLAILNYAVSPRIQRVKVIASGGSSENAGIWNYDSEAAISDVSVEVSGSASSNYGIWNSSDATPPWSPTINDATIAVSGATENYGIYSSHVSPTVTNVDVNVTNGSNMNYGIYNDTGAAPFIFDVTAYAKDATNNNYALFNSGSSSPVLRNSFVSASGGSGGNYGLFNNTSNEVPILEHSGIYGSTAAVYFDPSDAGGARISDTRISGGVVNDPAGTQCRGTYDSDLADVNC